MRGRQTLLAGMENGLNVIEDGGGGNVLAVMNRWSITKLRIGRVI